MAVRERAMNKVAGWEHCGLYTKRARKRRDETAAEVYRKARVAQHLREGKWWRVRHQSPMHNKLLHVNGHLYAIYTHVLADMHDRGNLGRRETIRWWELRSITGGESERFLSPLAVQRRIRELRAELPYQRETRPLLLPAAVQPVDVDTSQCWWNKPPQRKQKRCLTTYITIGSRECIVTENLNAKSATRWILADRAGQLKAVGFATLRDLQAYVRKVRAWARAAQDAQDAQAPPQAAGSPPQPPTKPKPPAKPKSNGKDWVQAVIAGDAPPDEGAAHPAALEALKAESPGSWYTGAAYLNYALGTDYLRDDLVAALRERYGIEDDSPPVREWWGRAVDLALEEAGRGQPQASDDGAGAIARNVVAALHERFALYGDALGGAPVDVGFGFRVERVAKSGQLWDGVALFHQSAPERPVEIGTAFREGATTWRVALARSACRAAVGALVRELGLKAADDEQAARERGIRLAPAHEVPY